MTKQQAQDIIDNNLEDIKFHEKRIEEMKKIIADLDKDPRIGKWCLVWDNPETLSQFLLRPVTAINICNILTGTVKWNYARLLTEDEIDQYFRADK